MATLPTICRVQRFKGSLQKVHTATRELRAKAHWSIRHAKPVPGNHSQVWRAPDPQSRQDCAYPVQKTYRGQIHFNGDARLIWVKISGLESEVKRAPGWDERVLFQSSGRSSKKDWHCRIEAAKSDERLDPRPKRSADDRDGADTAGPGANAGEENRLNRFANGPKFESK